jgi:hypothetical protein
VSRAFFVLAGYCAAVASVLFWQWLVKLDARSVWCVPATRLQSHYAGRRSNYIPRAGQVWKSSDPRRLSAFRIVSVDIPRGYVIEPDDFFYGWANDWKGCKAYIEMITNPGIAGKTARTIPVERFQVLGVKGYTRVA